jgi:uncharacterized pyridoxamine 5'-phosphate oxidase family protein
MGMAIQLTENFVFAPGTGVRNQAFNKYPMSKEFFD